jgi:hypothetical protein
VEGKRKGQDTRARDIDERHKEETGEIEDRKVEETGEKPGATVIIVIPST